MCGICGVVDPHGNAAAATARMLAQMHHRGPDDEGTWSHGQVSFGHRRLAILDLSPAGHQPMVSKDGTLALVANGEIYNYPDLRRELEERGAAFSSDCDSEVLLHAYRAYGKDAFEGLNGMFAFALYDTAAERLILVRDRRGIKPVYFFHDPETGRFFFASEIKAILAAVGRGRWSIDPEGLSQYLRFENLIGGRSLFAGIRILEPGRFLQLDREGLRIDAFSQVALPQGTPVSSFPDAVDRFGDTFEASVKRHLMSDVPVASYLSSGFDSTLVTSGAARLLPEPPLAFNGFFAEGGWYDETSGARLVAEHVGTPLNEVPISADDFIECFDDLVFALDEPRMGTGAFSQYVVARAAARERKVILTGHGGDELFSGYPVFKMAALSATGGVSNLLSLLGSLRPAEIPHIAYFMLRRLLPGGGSTHLPLLFSDKGLRQALTPQAHEAVSTHPSFAEVEAISEGSGSDYERILKTYLSIYLPGLLVVEDKISMAHSLEARTPFLDNEMVDLSLSISPETKLHNGALKAIIKEAARDRLPAALFALPKRGFPTPLSHWLRGPLADWCKDRLLGQESPLHRIVTPGVLRSEVDRYLTSGRRHVRPLDEIPTHRMWMLLSLESWLRQAEERLGVTVEL